MGYKKAAQSLYLLQSNLEDGAKKANQVMSIVDAS